MEPTDIAELVIIGLGVLSRETYRWTVERNRDRPPETGEEREG